MSKSQHTENTKDTKGVVPGALRPSSPGKRKFAHGIYFWLRAGKINPSIRGYKKMQSYLMDLEKQLIADAGGLDNLTAAREILIRSTIKAYGVVLLSEMFISKYSVLRPDKAKKGILEYQPILERSYFQQLAQIRQNLLALGLDRKASAELTFEQIVAEEEEKGGQGDGHE